ncbi:MAG: hypothetical protein JRF25_10665 [Deltaproteobacteria bacterium]|nr:hypothetical protein [Deltaproteobacteria bacterium]
MKKLVFTVMAIAAVTLALSATAYSWQGRMGGMGDPYGLTIDDSDFLIHPALITRGEGFDVYSHFDFAYTNINKWDLDIDIGGWEESFDSSGDQFDYGALLGTAFPLGTGRMGVFFAYEGMNRDIDGDADYDSSATDSSTSADYDLESDINDFSLRLIYGLPIDVNCLNVGAEAKISYIDEKQSNEWENNDGQSFLNHPMASLDYWWEANTLWFQVPYESDYWDAQFKASANGQICLDSIGPIDVTLSFGGGFIFAGDNEYKYELDAAGIGTVEADADGDVSGYNLGGDLWVRVPLNDDITLPFLVRAEHRQKTRDGKGNFSDPNAVLGIDGFDISYEHKEDSFMIEAGGGVDMKLSDSSRGTAGLFYTYVDSSNDVVFTLKSPGGGWQGVYDDSTPDYKEHRITLKLGWETALSSTTAIRTGFNTFYGFINKDYVFGYNDIFGNYETDNAKLDGYQWGIIASIGGTLKLQSVTLEPYINAGYRDLDLNGDLNIDTNLVAPGAFSGDIDESRQEWFVGAGLSVLFGI